MTHPAVNSLEDEAPRSERATGLHHPVSGRVGLMSWARTGVRRIWLFVVVLALWWVISDQSTSSYFPPLREIIRRFWELWIVGDELATLQASLQNFVIGYGLASVIGILLALLLWRLSFIYRATSPLIYFIYVIPSVALLPAVAAVLGYGVLMKVAIIVLATIWPTLLNSVDGLRSIDEVKLDTARVLGLSKLETVRNVVLPNASPQIFAGLRNSLQLAIILMVVSELVASTTGIGHFILTAQQQFQFTDMWTGVIVLALVGAALTAAFVAVERIVLRWYRSMQMIAEHK